MENWTGMAIGLTLMGIVLVIGIVAILIKLRKEKDHGDTQVR